MRLETKFIQVPNDPRHINAVNHLASAWGWSVQNIQVTNTKSTDEGDSHGRMADYGDSGTKGIFTEHPNYANITYQRDMDDPITPKLTALELKYNRCQKIKEISFLKEDDFIEYQKWSRLTSKKEHDLLIGKVLLVATVVCILLSYFGILLPVTDIVSFGCFGGAVIFFAKAYPSSGYRIAKRSEEALCKKGENLKQEMMERIMNEAKQLSSK